MERKIRNVAKIGVFAVAHDTYLGQFEGLWEKLNSYYYDFLHMGVAMCHNTPFKPQKLHLTFKY